METVGSCGRQLKVAGVVIMLLGRHCIRVAASGCACTGGKHSVGFPGAAAAIFIWCGCSWCSLNCSEGDVTLCIAVKLCGRVLPKYSRDGISIAGFLHGIVLVLVRLHTNAGPSGCHRVGLVITAEISMVTKFGKFLPSGLFGVPLRFVAIIFARGLRFHRLPNVF